MGTLTLTGRIAAGQRKELEREIAGLNAEAEKIAEGARELEGKVPFGGESALLFLLLVTVCSEIQNFTCAVHGRVGELTP